MNSSLSHIALLVPSVEASAKFLNTHGIETGEPETFESEGTKEIYVGSYATQKGLLLLLEPISEGPYRNAMTKRGPSVHHVAIDVLDVEAFTKNARTLGWMLHPISEQTMKHKTAWFFFKGIPTLIEVQQKKELSRKPAKISKLELPLQPKHIPLFEGIGLGEIVSPGDEIRLTVDDCKLSFAQLADRC